MHGKDIRMRSLDEAMSGIKTIKYNSYEELFQERVTYDTAVLKFFYLLFFFSD